MFNGPEEDETQVGVESTTIYWEIYDVAGARVDFTVVFLNDTDVACEKVVSFAIPAESLVSGYAVDIRGEMVSASIVQNSLARDAYETDLREGRSGQSLLAQSAQGNYFTVRISFGPKSRRIATLSLTQPPAQNGWYKIPLSFLPVNPTLNNTSTPLSLTVHVIDAEVSESKVPSQIEALSFERIQQWEFSALCSSSLCQRSTTCPMLEICVVSPPKLVYFQQHLPRSVPSSTSPTYQTFFWVPVPSLPELGPSIPLSNIYQSPIPKSGIAIVWDSSHSHKGSSKEFAFLTLLLHSIDLQEVEFVDLYFFNVVLHPPRHFNTSIGDYENLLNSIDSIEYTGATDFTCLSRLQNSHYKYALLFSDGIQTFSSDPIFTFEPSLPQDHQCKQSFQLFPFPLHCFCGTSGDNYLRLQRISEETGGIFMNLSENFPSNNELSTLLSVRRSLIKSVRVVDFNGDSEVFIAPAQSSTPASVYGRLDGKWCGVSLALQFEFQRGSVTSPITRNFEIPVSVFTTSNSVLACSWARLKLHEMLKQSGRSVVTPALLDVCRMYNTLTNGVSFLVLETLEEYLRHGVEPPSSQDQLHRLYWLNIRRQEYQAKLQQEKRKSAICDWWTSKVLSWENPHPGPGHIFHSMTHHSSSRFSDLPPTLPACLSLHPDRHISLKKKTRSTHFEDSPASSVTEESLGASMLKSMGWIPGQSLGKHPSTSLPPVPSFRCRPHSCGLASEPTSTSAAKQDTKGKSWKFLQKFYHKGTFFEDLQEPQLNAVSYLNEEYSVSHAVHKRMNAVRLISSFPPQSVPKQDSRLHDEAEPHLPLIRPAKRFFGAARVLDEGYLEHARLSISTHLLQSTESVEFIPFVEPKPKRSRCSGLIADVYINENTMQDSSQVRDLQEQLVSNSYRLFSQNRSNEAFYAISTLLDISHSPSALLLKRVGYMLWRWGEYDKAASVLLDLSENFPEQPGGLLDLSTVLCCSPVSETNASRFTKAISFLHKLLETKYDVVYSQIELIAISELGRAFAITNSFHLPVQSLSWAPEPRLLPLDLRVTVRYDTECELELIVEEPNGGRCTPFVNSSAVGGMLSREIKAGGPIEYSLRHAVLGHYNFQVQIPASTSIHQPVVFLSQVTTFFGVFPKETTHTSIGVIHNHTPVPFCDVSFIKNQ
ncbi:hypothetical protein Pelo_11403 [Pelomyxa schiedti]|nr:hypothetical protein Pelo_11403 [Pelomyxa schiedti]